MRTMMCGLKAREEPLTTTARAAMQQKALVVALDSIGHWLGAPKTVKVPQTVPRGGWTPQTVYTGGVDTIDTIYMVAY